MCCFDTFQRCAAKEYLTQLRTHAEDDFDARRGVTGGSDEEGEDDEDEDGGMKATKDRLTALLQLDAAQVSWTANWYIDMFFFDR